MKSVNSYLDAVKARLTQPKIKQLIQFAKCDPAKCNGPLISETGLQVTYDNILTGAKNMFEMCRGRDAVAEMVSTANFSEGIGYVDVANVNTVGAIDVTLLARAESLVSYLAVDRALPTPDATVYFQNLVALNNAGGFNAGDIVNGSYVPPSVKTELGLPTSIKVPATEGDNALSDSNIVPGSVKITLTNGSTSIIGGDFTKDGKIYFSGASTIASIDYATGIVSIEGLDGMTATIEAHSDSTKDTTGASIPRVGPQYVNVQLHSIPQNIILENNMLSQMYMNKTYTLSTGKSDAPYNDTTFQRVKDVYVEYINKRLLLPMIANTSEIESESLVDLTGYALNDFAYTKNDMIGQALNNMGAKLLRNTGVGMTTIVTNSYGAALLQNIKDLFVAAPDANKGLNGLVGYWQGIPVFRHNLLDVAFETANFDGVTKAEFIGCYKNPDNNSGSMVYGEFLPFTSTGLVGNFMNPTQIANGYFSQIATEVVQKNLFTRMEVVLPVYRGTTSTGAFRF